MSIDGQVHSAMAGDGQVDGPVVGDVCSPGEMMAIAK